MNILVIGKPDSDLITLLNKSKYTEKIYTALNDEVTEFPNIKYRNFEELIQKATALDIDIAINTEKYNISQGITEYFEQSKINLISVNKKWFNLEISRLSAKTLLNHYHASTPRLIKVPLKFPVVMKTDTPDTQFTIYSMSELIAKMEEYQDEKTFLEEFIEGTPFNLYMIWDKNNIKYFYNNQDLNEVQNEKLDFLKTKLNFMFSDEKADFMGIFCINLIWYKNDWYIDKFDTNATIPANCMPDTDFMYILNSALYQKLGEL